MFRSYFPIPAITHPPSFRLSSLSFWAFVSGVGRGRGGMGCSDGRVSEAVIVRLSVRSVRWVDRLANHVLPRVLSRFGKLGLAKSTPNKTTKYNRKMS